MMAKKATEQPNATIATTSLMVEEGAPSIAMIVKRALGKVGLNVSSSFQPEGACAALSEPCPHHGQRPCRCHLVLLTVEGFPLTSPRLIRIHLDEGSSLVQLEGLMIGETGRLFFPMIREALRL